MTKALSVEIKQCSVHNLKWLKHYQLIDCLNNYKK